MAEPGKSQYAGSSRIKKNYIHNKERDISNSIQGFDECKLLQPITNFIKRASFYTSILTRMIQMLKREQ
jgi:hypothetical protein